LGLYLQLALKESNARQVRASGYLPSERRNKWPPLSVLAAAERLSDLEDRGALKVYRKT